MLTIRDFAKTCASDSTLAAIVDDKPVPAGIDPCHELIDKVSPDNRQAVTLQ